MCIDTVVLKGYNRVSPGEGETSNRYPYMTTLPVNRCVVREGASEVTRLETGRSYGYWGDNHTLKALCAAGGVF